MKKIWTFTLFSVLLSTMFVCALLSANLYTYSQLAEEEAIAEITFQRVDEQVVVAELRTGDFCNLQRYTLYGDQWRIDAEFLKWKYWANLLGLDAQYRLDRISGRYSDIDDENRELHRAASLSSDTTFDLTGWTQGLGRFNFLFDASYGSSTYQTVDTDRHFTVYKTNTGIITRSKPRPQPEFEDGMLKIAIERGCGEPANLWRRVSMWADRLSQTLGDHL